MTAVSVDVVAVAAAPIQWAVFCEDCGYVADPTSDGVLADAKKVEHELTHA